MEKLGKRILAGVVSIALVVCTVFAADIVNERIGVKTTNGSTKASNIVGFDTDYMTIPDNQKTLYRFSVTTLADDQNLADTFYSSKVNPVKKEYGTEEWHKAISDYVSSHYVTGAGDGYWLGDHDTVDYRGHIIHAINKKEDENPYGKKLYEALSAAVENKTAPFNKSSVKPLYSFTSSTGYKLSLIHI